jgi:signal transduction histidine kinase
VAEPRHARRGTRSPDDATNAGQRDSRRRDHCLTISVYDTGHGLPAEQPDQIFAAFFSTKPQGSGMGLPIGRSIVEAHGGHLWATANAGRGATFHFTLPRDAANQPLAEPGRSS